MSRLYSLWDFICHHKYAVVVVGIVLMIGFLDDNSYVNRYQRWARLDNLRAEIEKYKAQYDDADAQLRSLQSDPHAVEKLAREKYFMKRADEDVFVVEQAGAQEPDSVAVK